MKEEKELVGVKEIARRANVSIATVDRVLHKRSGVSIKTKEKIEAIIKELDYQPNIFARRLASKKIIKIATLIPDIPTETTFWEAPLSGILKAQKEIKRYGIEIDNYFFDQNNLETFKEQTKIILTKKYDGILLAPMFVEESIEFVQACKRANTPYVFINSDIPNQDSLCYFGPNLYYSGYMGAHLFNYLLQEGQKILLVNISKINTHDHLLQKEEGFRSYFSDNNKNYKVVKIDITQTDYESVKREMDAVLEKEKDINAFFVTNSRVSFVAKYLEQHNLQKHILVGFDFLKENVDFLKRDTIDFLICQKPQAQGYRAVIALYNKLVHNISTNKVNFMPIDIITRENVDFYEN